MELLLSWKRSGFSVHVGDPIRGSDKAALERVARYVRRLHLAESRILYNEDRAEVIFSSGKKPHPGFKGNFRIFKAPDFVAAVAGFLPQPYQHESLAYGEYSNAVRGLRKRRRNRKTPLTDDELRLLPPDKQLWLSSWRELVKRIYEVDPLRCSCGGEMRIVSLITNHAVIARILNHQGLWPPPQRRPKPRSPPPPEPPPGPQPDETSQVPLWWDDDEAYSQVPHDENE